MKNLTITIILTLATFGSMSQEKYPLTQMTKEYAQQGFPCWSPDGEYIVYAQTDQHDTVGNNGLWRIKMADMSREHIFSDIAEHPRWSPDNRFIVFDADYGNNIQMIPVVGGDPINFLPTNIKIQYGGLPSWSPGGSKLVFKEGTTSFVWIYDMGTKAFTKIFDDQGGLSLPCCWTRDGKNILVGVRNRETNKSIIWKVSADGNSKEKITGHHENFYRFIDLSPDGKIMAYVSFNIEKRESTIWAMPAEGGKSVEIVAPAGFNEAPCWSPDGTQIAFTSTRSGSFDIWMVDIDLNALKTELGIM